MIDWVGSTHGTHEQSGSRPVSILQDVNHEVSS